MLIDQSDQIICGKVAGEEDADQHFVPEAKGLSGSCSQSKKTLRPSSVISYTFLKRPFSTIPWNGPDQCLLLSSEPDKDFRH
jgi:hypothetical protein